MGTNARLWGSLGCGGPEGRYAEDYITPPGSTVKILEDLPVLSAESGHQRTHLARVGFGVGRLRKRRNHLVRAGRHTTSMASQRAKLSASRPARLRRLQQRMDEQSAALPILRPLMNDFALPLTPLQQELVAVWAAKTAMVFEGTVAKGPRFYSRDERSGLRTRAAVPNDTFIWLGRFERSNVLTCEARRLFAAVGDDNATLGEGYATTLTLARLTVQVLTVRRAIARRAQAQARSLGRVAYPDVAAGHSPDSLASAAHLQRGRP